MNLHLALTAFLAIAFGLNVVAQQPPQAEIENAKLHAKIYLPDATKGFYRGTWFDWSGVISDLQFANHHLYRSWFNGVDASVRDVAYKGDDINVAPDTAMTGPVEEF